MCGAFAFSDAAARAQPSSQYTTDVESLVALSQPITAQVRKPLPVVPPRWRRYAIAYGLALPALALVLGMFAYPLIYELQLSLTNATTAADASDFIGLRNFSDILGNLRFWEAMRNTAFLVAVTTCAELLLGVAVALLLWRKAWLRPVLFVTVFLPWIYPSSFANYTWYWIILPPFHAFYTLDVISARFWLEGIFGEQAWQILSFALVCTWRGSSILAIVLLAGFRSIPRDLLDYARLDTASPLRHFWSVVVPLSRRFLVLAGVVAITVAYLDYLAMYIESNGRITVPVLGTLVYQAELMEGRVGYAAALSLVQLPVVVALVLLAFPFIESHISRHKVPEASAATPLPPPSSMTAEPSRGASHGDITPPSQASRGELITPQPSHEASRGDITGSSQASRGALIESQPSRGASRAAYLASRGAAVTPKTLMSNALRSLACLAIAGFYLFPLYYTAVQSVKSQQDFIKGPLGQPFWVYRFDFRDGLLDTLRNGIFWRAGFVTLVVFVSVLLVGIAVSLLAGYALARLRPPGSDWLARLLFATYFIPQIAILVPLLQLFSSLGLENTLLGLVLLYLTLAIPFATWLFYIYFESMDVEAEEHALLDGSRLRAFLGVVLPRAWPVIVAAAVFAIGMMSSDLLYGRVFTVSRDTRTLPMTMGSMVYDPDNWADANGAILLGALPLLIVALALGRWFVRGLQAAFNEET